MLSFRDQNNRINWYIVSPVYLFIVIYSNSKFTVTNENVKTITVLGHQPQNSISAQSKILTQTVPQKKYKKLQCEYNYDLQLLLQKSNTHSLCGLKAQVFSSQKGKTTKRRKTSRLTLPLFNNARKHNISTTVIRSLRPQGPAPV